MRVRHIVICGCLPLHYIPTLFRKKYDVPGGGGGDTQQKKFFLFFFIFFSLYFFLKFSLYVLFNKFLFMFFPQVGVVARKTLSSYIFEGLLKQRSSEVCLPLSFPHQCQVVH